MTMYLLTSSDYSAVLGYAECARGYDQHRQYAPQVTAYNTDQAQVFTRKGLTSAERRAHELGMRLVAQLRALAARITALASTVEARLSAATAHHASAEAEALA